jgi:hypothetical protein
MPPLFQFRPYQSQHTGTIAELMMAPARARADAARRSGDIQAQAALQKGQIWGNTIGSIGQLASGAIQQYQQDKLDEPRRELLGLQVEQAQGSVEDAQRGRAEEQALRQLYAKGVPQPEELFSVVGPDRGAAILKGFAALREQNIKTDDQVTQKIASLIGAVQAHPAGLRQDAYTAARENVVQMGLARPEDVPEQYDEGFVNEMLWRAMTAQQQYEASQPRPMVVGGNIVDARAPGAPLIYEAPPTPVMSLSPDKGTLTKVGDVPANAKVVAEPQPPRVTVTTPTVRFRPREMTRPDGTTVVANYDNLTGKYHDPDTGEVLSGLKPPPTADMRNKAEGRRLVERSITAIEDLSKKVITKRGVAQRATAAGRSVESALGRDPEYRTYQDARMALAGNLAVAQQGSRPSDADIKAIWLPLVPDVFRDTDESALMKWSLIKTMSNVSTAPASAPAPKADPLGIRSAPAPKADPLGIR